MSTAESDHGPPEDKKQFWFETAFWVIMVGVVIGVMALAGCYPAPTGVAVGPPGLNVDALGGPVGDGGTCSIRLRATATATVTLGTVTVVDNGYSVLIAEPLDYWGVTGLSPGPPITGRSFRKFYNTRTLVTVHYVQEGSPRVVTGDAHCH